MSNADLFLEKALGKDFFESLSKSEIWKPGTKSVNDLEDMKIGLQIVPRTTISLLIRELGPMKVGDNKRISILLGGSNGDATINVTKHERDVYSGDIEQAGNKLTEFKFRSLPGIGLVIMSTFELYNMENLINAPQYQVPTPPPTSTMQSGAIDPHAALDAGHQVQRMIDERIALHELIGQVVEKKMAQKDAIVQLMLTKLSDELSDTRKLLHATADLTIQNAKEVEEAHKKTDTALGLTKDIKVSDKEGVLATVGGLKKGSPVKDFLAKRQSKKEFTVHMTKGEAVDCPDCFQEIFNKSGFSGCVCFGADMDNHVFVKKSENGVKVSFPKSWDADNIQMLLEILQKKNRG
jgi:hypothetical protein